jgi:hypothetical protein
MLNKFKQRKTKNSRKYTYSPKKSIRDEEVAVYRKLALTAVLVIGFAVSLYLWGIPLVVKLGDFWDQFGSQQPGPTPTAEQSQTTLISPRLNALPAVVNSTDDVIISGTAPAGYDVAIYINDEKQVTVLAGASGSFEVKDLRLTEGDNKVSAKTVSKEGESASSNIQIVTFDATIPEVQIIQPADGATTQDESVEIIGTTEPQARLTINGSQAIVNATTGDFTKTVTLKGGENVFEIVTTDKAGNEKKIQLTIVREVPQEEKAQVETEEG